MSPASRPTPTSRRAVIGAAFVLGFALSFTTMAFRSLPVAWYEPLARRWDVAAHAGSPASPAMDWYGRVAVAAGVAVATAVIAAAGVRLLGREPGRASFGPVALAINTGVLFWLCAFAYAWTLAHRAIHPTPPMAFESTAADSGSQARP